MDRINRLSGNYLIKAYKNNPAINQLVENYNSSAFVNQGALLCPKYKPRKTILGILNQSPSSHSKKILKEAIPQNIKNWYPVQTRPNQNDTNLKNKK